MRYSYFLVFAWYVSFSFCAHADSDPITDSELTVHKTCSLEAIWKDKGSGADLDGFFYLPYVDTPAFILGGYGSRTKKLSSTDCVLTISDEKHLVAPVDWELIWKDKGSGAKKDGSMWRAIPPSDEYVCIGTIPQKGYEKPVLPNYRCVNAIFTEKVITNSLIWSDKGSGAKKKVTMFKLPNSGSFVAVEARLAQLETYDLKVDSSLFGVIDEAEALAGANTQDSSKENGNNKIFGNLLGVKEQVLKNLAIQEGTAPPEDEGCYYDRGQKKCDKEGYNNFFGFSRSRANNEYKKTDPWDDVDYYKKTFCEHNKGNMYVKLGHLKEARGNPAAYDAFGTVVIDCVLKEDVLEFTMDVAPFYQGQIERLLWAKKLTGKEAILVMFDTDGTENEFERQMKEKCDKNNIHYLVSKTDHVTHEKVQTHISEFKKMMYQFCEHNKGVQYYHLGSLMEAQKHPASRDKRFGTVRPDCMNETEVMEFAIDDRSDYGGQVERLLWAKKLLAKKVNQSQSGLIGGDPRIKVIDGAIITPYVIMFDTDGVENEFERQLKEQCAKNNIQYFVQKTF